jgi:UPF0755 protein
MLKKILLILVLVAVIIAAFVGWRFFLPNTNFDQASKYLYIRTGKATRQAVMASLRDSGLIKNPGSFEVLADQTNVWKRLRPGRYEIKKNTSLFTLARILRNGMQAPVDLVITKLRTKEQLAGLIGRKFETDSAAFYAFLSNNDTLKKYELDSNTIMTAVFPNTYTYFWNATPAVIFRKLYAEHQRVWNEERKQLAAERGLTPASAYILASIVEEETNINDEKGNMSSVYLNRLRRGMRLGADPTVKFALRDFDLKRIYQKHLAVESPYNTYRNYGLPPGPICTPSLKTLDAVLNSPQTNYLYFVAKSDFSQRHVFTESYADHLKYAREYQKALNELQKQQGATNGTGN